MPELPDVEVLKQYVDATSLHRQIEDVFLREEIVDGVSPQTVRDKLEGSAFDETRRHGKHLFVHTSDDAWLRLHFGMTGTLRSWFTGSAPEYVQMSLDFDDNSHLGYLSTRKLGAISWVESVEGFIEEESLGPDLLTGMDSDSFVERVGERNGGLKSALMNQKVVAGLGNIYVDEILFQAGLHPESDAALPDDRLQYLYRVADDVVTEAIERDAVADSFPRTWLTGNREEDKDCPRCDGTIINGEVAGRSTFLCSQHQAKEVG